VLGKHSNERRPIYIGMKFGRILETFDGCFVRGPVRQRLGRGIGEGLDVTSPHFAIFIPCLFNGKIGRDKQRFCPVQQSRRRPVVLHNRKPVETLAKTERIHFNGSKRRDFLHAKVLVRRPGKAEYRPAFNFDCIRQTCLPLGEFARE
jgi:hypothetical protein